MAPKTVQALQTAFKHATGDAAFLRALETGGQRVNFMDSAAYTRFVNEEFASEKRLIGELKAAGVVLN